MFYVRVLGCVAAAALFAGSALLGAGTAPAQPRLSAADNYNEAYVYPLMIPTDLSPPTVAGVVAEGQTLTESHGAWTNNPTGYSYQWQQCDSSGDGCTAIGGALGQTYTPAASDVGHTLRVQETAINPAGTSSPATSARTALVAPPPPGIATSTAPPTISGTVTEGETLTEAHGAWTSSPSGYGYQWQQCDSAGTACAAIGGALGQSYTLVAADVGHTIRVQETAINGAGTSLPATSAATAVVAPAAFAASTGPRVKAALVTALTPRGKHVTIAAILKAGGFMLSFHALEPGRATVSWAQAGSHTAHARHHATVIASGAHRFAHAGTAKLLVKLTAAGTRLFKHAKKLKLTATGSFTPAGSSGVRATKTFELGR